MLLLGVAAWHPAWPQSSATAQPAATAARITHLADEYVREYVARCPEAAFLAGLPLPRHDGICDNSLTRVAAWEKHEDRWWRALDAIDPATVWGKPEWVTYGFLREALEASRGARVCRRELWPVNQLSGWQALFAQLASVQPVGSPELRAQALTRWRKLPHYLDVEIANLREGLRQGYSTPRRNVELTIGQIEALLTPPLEQSPFYSPAARDSTPAFRSAWASLLQREITLAIRRYLRFLSVEYLPKARAEMAISAQRDGAQCYAALFRTYTSLDRPARETYGLGQARVAGFEAEISRIGAAELGTGDIAALRARVDTDAANRFHSREEVLAFSRAVVERAKAALPKWFGRLPRADAVIQPQPDFLGASAFDQYNPPAQDGSRAGIYLISLYHPEKKLRSEAEVTAFHEVYPGHHLLQALAQERPGAHPIALLVGTAAFDEGWARYAEQLAEEMGLYSSPFARIRRRSWPGHGMVVDPGVHMLGWSRDSA
ncbi:MAG TPA: DUF885 domain-containing protein, partial [Gemmatimonadales bacterium]|nr:DUF885 domain-containing protein [Gemmatimonadales bacterium]